MSEADRGFASMDPTLQRQIASKGGKAAHEKGTAHQWTAAEASAAGRKGGLAVQARNRMRTPTPPDTTEVIAPPPVEVTVPPPTNTPVLPIIGTALALLLCLLCASAASAQTNITVVGSGRVAFDMPAPTLADAQAYVYKAYVPSGTTTPVTVTATCIADTGTDGFDCTFLLSALPLTVNFQSLALTAGVSGADGTAEGAKAVAPFLLRKVGPPASPVVATMSIRP